ncbi:MAG: agmatine deiminase family protein [bacterium]|nr:agmatine deiminase family protein [bacterium]
MKTPRELGLRWPAEWEPHRATWLVWPHNRSTWPGRLEGAEQAFVEMVRALHGVEEVCIGVQDEAHGERVAKLLAQAGPSDGQTLKVIPTNDAWVRDHGPVFLTDTDGEVHAVDFRFDAWGKKYPPWELDDAVAAQISELRGTPCHRADFVLEAGSVDGNGAGTILTTASCLLGDNRRLPGEPKRSIERMQQRLRDWLGAECVLWLGEGIVGDDTDGHVDDIARFVSELVVVAAVEPDPSDANHAPLAENLDRLQRMRDARGRPFDVVPLPMPPPVFVDGLRCPASYANFYLANDVALVPVFGSPSDERALDVLREVLPDRQLAPIPARDLVLGLGACHCVTQQEPAGP